ncbi:MAG: mechanosensitive ion channel [Candidatus Caldarchaeum sp.]|uniref:Mechanosensitive ion channel n=3 Tax=Caldiarchaeum subterraneum TaxID=311458 RepID=A0A7C4E187_CALS0
MASSPEQKQVARKTVQSSLRLVMYVILYVAAAAVFQLLLFDVLPGYGIALGDYAVYGQVLLALGFGYLIVSSISAFVYWTLRVRYEHPVAAAVRNLSRILGLGALVASIAGGVGGAASGVALGGFIGIVIGFASQQILGQALAGLFVLITRPFKIGDSVNVAGEEGLVEDITTLFTIVAKPDGTKTLIPNNAILGGKIHIKPSQ